MSAEAKPLNPFLTTLVVIAVLAFTLSAVFAGMANAQATSPREGLDVSALWATAGWMLVLAVASTLAALTAAAARWQPRTAAPAETRWTISYPDPDEQATPR